MDKRIGVQMFTVREHTKTVADFAETCKKIAQMGYTTVQVSGTPLEAKDMRPILDEYGLKVVTTHKGFADFQENLSGVIEYNRILGSELCGMGCIPEWARADRAAVDRYIAEVNRVAAILKSEGMRFGHHNHSYEYMMHEGGCSFDRMVAETDPDAVSFILDTYWVQFSGRSPEKEIRALGKRAEVVHLKDYRIEGDDWKTPKMGEVGLGQLDWDGILAACEDAGTKWAVVEQDTNHMGGDPFASLAASREFLNGKGYL
ncbi:MAG: sugar phosphate isomerase/epimerase [Clostridia bacterium]|nr:sugar phosphate isomerase/epimerase [Clostridia bacterium]